MKTTNPLRETLAQAGYRYALYLGNQSHLLADIDSGKEEIWVANNNHASYGIIYKNTVLEFASSPVKCNANGMRL